MINHFSNEKIYKRNLMYRFGNVIGSDGSALPYFFNQIKSDLPISLTDINEEIFYDN